MSFFYYYLRSMRLYYGFVTGSTTLLGVIAAHYWTAIPFGPHDVIIPVIGFLAWGVNQIFNDLHDRKADAVNAPHRPITDGRLTPGPAALLSIALMAGFGVVSGLLAPWSLLPVAAGGVLNLFYSYCKRIPVLNCLVYGSSISMCAAYGWLGVSDGLPQGALLTQMLLLLLFVLPAHVLMCHNSYFKDVAGDRAAGTRTLQTLFPAGASLWISGLGALCYTGFVFSRMLDSDNLLTGIIFLIWLLLLAAVNLADLRRKRFHRAVCSGCQLCVAWVLALAADFTQLMLPVAGGCFFLIELLFRWYPDEKE